MRAPGGTCPASTLHSWAWLSIPKVKAECWNPAQREQDHRDKLRNERSAKEDVAETSPIESAPIQVLLLVANSAHIETRDYSNTHSSKSTLT